jgi:hypothetical protein
LKNKDDQGKAYELRWFYWILIHMMAFVAAR